ncbi:MAG: transposase [Saprospiraceae bacterium]
MALPLKGEITEYFPHHSKTVVKNLLITSEAIFESESTNLNKVKKKVGKVTGKLETKPSSNYIRLIRFFKVEDKRELIRSLVCLCVCLLESKSKIKYLTLDGTSWELGDKKVHLLTLCIVYEGVSIPIWWEELDKKGHSNFKERKRVIREASKTLNLSGLVLLADREYIGRGWFNYLTNKKIGFIIRLKAKTYCTEINEASDRAKAEDIFQKARYSKLVHMASFRKYRKQGVGKRFRMYGKSYTFVVIKNRKDDPKEPLLYFISTLKDKVEVVKTYPIRWTIECCFKHLKTNGFDLEAMNFKDPLKIMLMMAITSFLYVLCIIEGLKQLKVKKKSDWKKYKSGKITLAVSIFAKGLDYLNNKFRDLESFIEFLKSLLRQENLSFFKFL